MLSHDLPIPNAMLRSSLNALQGYIPSDGITDTPQTIRSLRSSLIHQTSFTLKWQQTILLFEQDDNHLLQKAQVMLLQVFHILNNTQTELSEQEKQGIVSSLGHIQNQLKQARSDNKSPALCFAQAVCSFALGQFHFIKKIYLVASIHVHGALENLSHIDKRFDIRSNELQVLEVNFPMLSASDPNLLKGYFASLYCDLGKLCHLLNKTAGTLEGMGILEYRCFVAALELCPINEFIVKCASECTPDAFTFIQYRHCRHTRLWQSPHSTEGQRKVHRNKFSRFASN